MKLLHYVKNIKENFNLLRNAGLLFCFRTWSIYNKIIEDFFLSWHKLKEFTDKVIKGAEILFYNPMILVIIKIHCLKSNTCSQKWVRRYAIKMKEILCVTHFVVPLTYGHCSMLERKEILDSLRFGWIGGCQSIFLQGSATLCIYFKEGCYFT